MKGADTVDTVLVTDKTSGGWGDEEGDGMALKAKSGWAQKENAEALLVGTASPGGAKGGPAQCSKSTEFQARSREVSLSAACR